MGLGTVKARAAYTRLTTSLTEQLKHEKRSLKATIIVISIIVNRNERRPKAIFGRSVCVLPEYTSQRSGGVSRQSRRMSDHR